MGIPDIATVPQYDWNPSDNSAEELVTELMGYLKEKSQEAFDDLKDAIEDLTEEITEANMPTTTVNYNHVTDDFEIGDTGTRPTPPTFPSTAGIDKPDRPDIIDITLPVWPTIPTFSAEAPTAAFDYDEDQYTSDILTTLKSKIYSWLTTDGVEMDTLINTAMDATWTRSRSRINVEWAAEQNRDLTFYGARGWNLHAGNKNTLLARTNLKWTRILAEKESEITALEADLKIKNRQWTVELAVKFETALMELADKYSERMYKAAKDAVVLLYEIFKYRVEAYVAEIQGLSVDIDAKAKIIDAQLGINKGKVDIYTAELGGYKTEIEAIIAVVDGQARLYAAQVGGYEADIKAATAELTARVERLKALISQATDQTNLQIKEAEIDLQAYLGSLGLNQEASKAVAGILGQIAASSLGALNTHTSMGDSTNRSFNKTHQHSEGISNTKSHTYQETGAAEE